MAVLQVERGVFAEEPGLPLQVRWGLTRGSFPTDPTVPGCCLEECAQRTTDYSLGLTRDQKSDEVLAATHCSRSGFVGTADR